MDKLDALALPREAADTDVERSNVGLMQLLVWLGEGKRLIATVTFAAALFAVGYSLLQPNVFTARTTLLPPGSNQSSSSAAALAALGSVGGMAGLPSGLAPKTPDELYVSLLKSDSVLRALAKRFDLYKRYEIKSHEVLRKTMPQYVRITSDKKSSVISVEVDDKDPKFAADLANAHLDEITKLAGRLAVSEAQQRRVFYEQQLKATKEKLVDAEKSLRVVQEKSGMIVLDKQAEAIIQSVADLKTKIIERDVRLKIMRTITTAENPDLKRQVLELNALRGELARMETYAPAAAAVAETASAPAARTGTGTGLDIPIGNLPAAAVDYVRAAREVKFQESMLSSMLRQFEVAKMDEAKEGPGLQQVDVAMPPDHKSKPVRSVMVLTMTLLAFLGASGFVIWRRYRAVMRSAYPERDQAWAQLSQAWKLKRARKTTT